MAATLFTSGIARADLNVESYCALLAQDYEVVASSLADALQILNEHSDSPIIEQQKQDERLAEADAKMKALFSSAGTTDADYLLFLGAHRKEIDQYLADHSAVKEYIDELSVEIEALDTEYEELRVALDTLPDPQPPAP